MQKCLPIGKVFFFMVKFCVLKHIVALPVGQTKKHDKVTKPKTWI